jgi:predicted Zn-ribbon and HTH transcriptional regulator
MEQLKILDLTRIEAEENMEHIQTMRKKRQDKTLIEGKRCKHCKQTFHDTKERSRKTNQTQKKLKENKFPKFYKGQKVLWHPVQANLGFGRTDLTKLQKFTTTTPWM